MTATRAQAGHQPDGSQAVDRTAHGRPRSLVAALAAGTIGLAGAVHTASPAVADDEVSDVPFVSVGSTSEQDPSDNAFLSPVDTRFGQHGSYARVVMELAGEGVPGWFVRYDDDPRYQGSGFGSTSTATRSSVWP